VVQSRGEICQARSVASADPRRYIVMIKYKEDGKAG